MLWHRVCECVSVRLCVDALASSVLAGYPACVACVGVWVPNAFVSWCPNSRSRCWDYGISFRYWWRRFQGSRPKACRIKMSRRVYMNNDAQWRAQRAARAASGQATDDDSDDEFWCEAVARGTFGSSCFVCHARGASPFLDLPLGCTMLKFVAGLQSYPPPPPHISTFWRHSSSGIAVT